MLPLMTETSILAGLAGLLSGTTARSGALVGRAHDFDQRNELHPIAGVENLDSRFVNLQVFNLDDHGRI